MQYELQYGKRLNFSSNFKMIPNGDFYRSLYLFNSSKLGLELIKYNVKNRK